MDDCVFCKIIKGEIPSFKVYEDNSFFGFLDIKPLNPGNALLVPKTHYRWVTDIPNFGDCWEKAKLIALASQKVVKSDYTTFVTFGTDVPHAHIRIVPRFYTDHHHEGINAHDTLSLPPQEMSRIASEMLSLTK